ncbi:MAG: flagellar basal body P-ring formation chaperone FlgA [Sulfuricurvum sp.]|uniref:flagellar basal body P-ring formation chaperone FlgA n=1 Tax=Sulfuricurvum sp. TaxID=2025608 RepID=UPI002636BBE3|nr:flagellar basal body P-ring formation chaperone FlgA [Sulfuricurvum sp.]MDD2829570.1 flagellar basal body P-ring formation chaperone FlgA [Sulfuricurvum sp.]MDD4950383.1 flagellar basal body P-ring formation chaperone FlgA [Sulfuricurvum sp.]
MNINVINAALLQSNYFFDSPTIMSHALDPKCPKNFELLRIPEGESVFRVNAQVILKSFELEGCEIENNTIHTVTFTKQSSTDLKELEKQVERFFKAQYPTIQIESIHIFPHGYIDSLNKTAKAIFEPNASMKSKGVFYVQDSHGLRRYFDFSIEATLSILHTSKKVSRKEILSLNNVLIKTIPFKSFQGKPIISLNNESQRFRASLKENTPILDRNIEPLPLVFKDSKVSVVVRNETVEVEFIATATQEGALYDIITIEKSDGKRGRAKIIGENQVELQ